AKDAVDKTANAIGDTTSMFGAIGSWKPGRDMDVVYFGKKTSKAKETLTKTFDSILSRIISEGLQNDDLIKSLVAKGFIMPKDISSKTMSFGLLELPDFGYGKMGSVFEKGLNAHKQGIDGNVILKKMEGEFLEAMLDNFEAHIATTASGDFYRGVSGQQWFMENYLRNPEKMRVFEFSMQDGSVVLRLKKGGISAVPEDVLKKIGITDYFLKPFMRDSPDFAKQASNLSLFFEHQKGGISDIAKYHRRSWDELARNIIYSNQPWQETLEDVKLASLARKIMEDPSNAERLIRESGMSSEAVTKKMAQNLMKWTERQMIMDVEGVVNELTILRFSPKPGSLVEQIEQLRSAGKMKLDAMEIVSGLEKIQKSNPEFAARLINTLESRFTKTKAGEIIVKYIKIQLKLLADESGELAARILSMLRKMNKISEADYQKALKARSLEDMPANVSSSFKRAKAEIMLIASANMTSLDDSEDFLDLLFEIWRKKNPQALLTGKSPQLLEFINEIKTKDVQTLKQIGWDDKDLILKSKVKERLQYSPQKIKLIGHKLGEKVSKNGLSLRQLQEKIYEILFSEAYTKFGDDMASVGAMDLFLGVALALYQSYDIIFNERYPSEADENLALANAWVTSIPVVGDFAQGIITGIEGGFEGDKIKIIEGGLWITIGIMGFVPGGQIPAVVAGLTLGFKPVAVNIYNAYDAQQLIQTWIESAEWSGDKPPKLIALFDRKRQKHLIKYEQLLTREFAEVPYLSKRYGDVTIAQSIRQYADKFIAPQYPGLESLRDALKQLYPDFNDKDWEDQTIADYKIDVRGGKAGKMVFKAYERIRTKIYNETIAHLKKWAEDELRAAKNYDEEITKLRERIRQLERELNTSNILKNADASVEAYSRIIINKFEQESLPLSKIRIYEHYVKIYNDLLKKINQINQLTKEASIAYKIPSWHLMGYPDFDKDRITHLLGMIEQGKRGVIKEIESILKENEYEGTLFDWKNECHKKAYEELISIRYKIAFAENLIEYYRQLIRQSSGWTDAFEFAKAEY
ncbi:MAG: hypothetical protein SNJ53_08205, partial [Thermodesulfovibrionales bacterium]